jgi:hypothetical protein
MFITLDNNLVSFYPVRNECITKTLERLAACNAAMKLESWHYMRLSIGFTKLHEYMKV